MVSKITEHLKRIKWIIAKSRIRVMFMSLFCKIKESIFLMEFRSNYSTFSWVTGLVEQVMRTGFSFTYMDVKWFKRVLKTMFKFTFLKVTRRRQKRGFRPLWLCQSNMLFATDQIKVTILCLKISVLSEICILGPNLFHSISSLSRWGRTNTLYIVCKEGLSNT